MVSAVHSFWCWCVLIRRLVVYADSESAERALRDLTDTEIDGRKLFLRKVGKPHSQTGMEFGDET